MYILLHLQFTNSRNHKFTNPKYVIQKTLKCKCSTACIHVHVHLYLCTYEHTYTDVNMHTQICRHMHTHTPNNQPINKQIHTRS